MGYFDVSGLARDTMTPSSISKRKNVVIYIANTSWYLYNFRLSLMIKMIEKGWKVLAVAPEEEYKQQIEDAGIVFRNIPQSRKVVSPLADFLFSFRLFNLYLKEKPTLVHLFTIKPAVYGSISASFGRVKGIVISVTGLGYMFMTNGLQANLLRLIVNSLYKISFLGNNKCVIFQNPDDKVAFISGKLLKSENAFLIRSSGVDIKRFIPAEKPKGEPVILMSARMLWAKGVGDLVSAARLLRDWRVPGKVILAGSSDSGNPTAIPEEQLNKWNSEGVVLWIGYQKDIQKTYSSALIGVLPTYYPEGVPKSLIEAAACGLPLVATDMPGCREVVRDGENGFLVPVKDPKALAIAIKNLIENEELRLKMGKRSREIVETEFLQDKIISETISIYERVLGQKIKIDSVQI